MWKKLYYLIPMLGIILMFPYAHAGSGFESAPGFIYSLPVGNLTQVNDVFYTSWTVFPVNNTIRFDLTGQFPRYVQFTVNSFGNGTLSTTFVGPKPIVLGVPDSASYSGGVEVIKYTRSLSVSSLVLLYQQPVAESQSVLFRDDFLYTNPLAESSWTIDQYTNPGTNSGEYTSSGYLVIKATSIATSAVHVTSAMFNPSSFTTGTAVKRKMTVALIPFAKTESPQTASITAGTVPLLSSGGYPGTTPYGTPAIGVGGSCTGNSIGSSYMSMDNSGTVGVTTCGDGGNNTPNLESGLNPSLYTVFTIETYGIFCSTCTDNSYAGSSWTWFRVYQENSIGQVIQSTDKNLNFTSNVAPLFQTNYAFVSQTNTNSGATGQISKIDFVSVQNYGSPVCLTAPAGFLCTRLPSVPSGIIGNNGLVGLIAWLANQVGFGDEQLGALILFFAMFFGAAFLPYYFSHNLPVGAFGAMLTLGFFTYVGFLPIFTLILVFMGGAAIVVILVIRMLSGTSMGGFGGGGSE